MSDTPTPRRSRARQTATDDGEVSVLRLMLIGVAVVVVVAGVVAGSLYLFARTGDRDPVRITADSSPVREAPEDPGGRQVDHQETEVFDLVSPDDGGRQGGERLLPRAEEPIDRDSGTQALLDGPGDSPGDSREDGPPQGANDTAEASGSRSAQQGNASGSAQAAERQETAGAADGTSGAETQQLGPRADREPDAGAADRTGSAESSASSGSGQTPGQTVTPRQSPRRNGASTASPGQGASGQGASGQAASGQGSGSGDVATLDRSYRVQVASVPRRDAVDAEWARLQREYEDELAGRRMNVREAQIEGRGTFYRIQVGPMGSDEANRLCQSLKDKGGSCLVLRR